MSIPEPEKRRNLDALRVYAPSRGNLAIKSEALPATRVAEPAPSYQPRRRPTLVPKAPAVKRRTLADVLRERKVLPRAAAVGCVFAVALALIVMLSGYNNISAAQREINKLSKRVEETKSVVEKTNVDYLFAIDVGSAQASANEAGMSYPSAGSIGN